MWTLETAHPEPVAVIAGDARRVGVVYPVLEQPVCELLRVVRRWILCRHLQEPGEQLPAGGAVDAATDLIIDVAVLPHAAQPLLLHLLSDAALQGRRHPDPGQGV